jgi:hypothetical protein
MQKGELMIDESEWKWNGIGIIDRRNGNGMTKWRRKKVKWR